MESLLPIHNENGIIFDGFLENQFGWTDANRRYAYTDPWVGVFHNPPLIPDWFFNEYSFDNITKSEVFQESLQHCKGIFTLSEYHAEYIRSKLDVPVTSLIHPTEIPNNTFNIAKFKNNPNKKIINIGFWLRRMTSIYRLPVNTYYDKCRLIPYNTATPKAAISNLLNTEIERNNVKWNEYFDHTITLDRVSNAEYDTLLSQNIIFLDLYDSSANNAVIECIARCTPLLINPIPAVVEYLGPDYPFYFNSLEEAAVMVKDFELVEETHRYLKTCDTRKKLSQAYFRKSIIESNIYEAL